MEIDQRFSKLPRYFIENVNIIWIRKLRIYIYIYIDTRNRDSSSTIRERIVETNEFPERAV